MKVTVWYDSDSIGTMDRFTLDGTHVRSQLWPDGRARIQVCDDTWRVRQSEQLRVAHRISVVMEVPGG